MIISNRDCISPILASLRDSEKLRVDNNVLPVRVRPANQAPPL